MHSRHRGPPTCQHGREPLPFLSPPPTTSLTPTLSHHFIGYPFFLLLGHFPPHIIHCHLWPSCVTACGAAHLHSRHERMQGREGESNKGGGKAVWALPGDAQHVLCPQDTLTQCRMAMSPLTCHVQRQRSKSKEASLTYILPRYKHLSTKERQM